MRESERGREREREQVATNFSKSKQSHRMNYDLQSKLISLILILERIPALFQLSRARLYRVWSPYHKSKILFTSQKARFFEKLATSLN